MDAKPPPVAGGTGEPADESKRGSVKFSAEPPEEKRLPSADPAPLIPNFRSLSIKKAESSSGPAAGTIADDDSPREDGDPSKPNFTLTRSLSVGKDALGNTHVNQYVVIKQLGQGSYGKVKLSLDTAKNRLCAVKMVEKAMLKKRRIGQRSPLDDVKKEVAIMKKLQHPNIVRLYEVIDDPEGAHIYMVMEYVEGGTVLPKGNTVKPIPEGIVLHYVRDLCKGLDYLHFNSIVHRDLKPENMLMASNGNVKIADFGVSDVTKDDDDEMGHTAGTPAFFAPEMCVKGPYHGKSTDVWALGACIYMFMFGRVPFWSDSMIKMYEMIRTASLEFPADIPCSDPLRELISRMLEKNPDSRITLPEVMEHPWVTTNGEKKLVTYQSLNPEAQTVSVTDAEMDDAVQSSEMSTLLDPDLPQRTYADADYLMRQGEDGHSMFFINSGECEILIEDTTITEEGESDEDDDFADDFAEEEDKPAPAPTHHHHHVPKESVVAIRVPGQFIGEMAIFDPKKAKRTASVRAKGPVTVIEVTREQVNSMLQARPEAAYEILQTISRRKSEALIFSTATRLGAGGITPEQLAAMSANTTAETADMDAGRTSTGPSLQKRISFNKSVNMGKGGSPMAPPQ